MGDKEREREVWEQNQAQVCPSPHRTHMSVLDVLDASEKLLIVVKRGSRKKNNKKTTHKYWRSLDLNEKRFRYCEENTLTLMFTTSSSFCWLEDQCLPQKRRHMIFNQ